MRTAAALLLFPTLAYAQLAPAGSCAGCHADLARKYAGTPMAQSFGRVTSDTVIPPIAGGVFRHQASSQSFSINREEGRNYLNRNETGFDGNPAPGLSKEIAFWFGSGNHARSYISQNTSGELLELPLTWYSENGGYWDMSPAYDRSDHPGFSRKITYRCMFCHNADPGVSPGTDQFDAGARFPAALPQGIDCQRCHGPGARHVNAATAGLPVSQIRSAIVNPARLTTSRRDETCLQCHLETTSQPFPSALLRPGRGVFSFRPGEPLADYMLYFDRDAKPDPARFEFVSAPYRLSQSACFRANPVALTCTTCHDPHGGKRDYAAICGGCHAERITGLVKQNRHTGSGDCVPCHMPKRRPSDASHVLVTDHLIGKFSYAGEPTNDVVLYYPPEPTTSPRDELLLDVARIRNRANPDRDLRQLQSAIDKYRPSEAFYYFELAEGLRAAGRIPASLLFYREACSRAPAEWRYFYTAGVAQAAAGQTALAVQTLTQAKLLAPHEPVILQALGNVQSRPGELGEALRLDPDDATIRNDLGAVLLKTGDAAGAEKELREAVRLRPELAAIRINLAELQARSGRFPEAKHNFETAIRGDPDSAQAHSRFGTALAGHGELAEARRHYETALRLDPGLFNTHNNLGTLLLKEGDVASAIREYNAAITGKPDFAVARYNLAAALAGQSRLPEAERQLRRAVLDSPEYFEAWLKLGLILQNHGERAEAVKCFNQAVRSTNLSLRQAAQQALSHAN